MRCLEARITKHELIDCQLMRRMIDGPRTRALRSHKSSETRPVRSSASMNILTCRYFARCEIHDCPLRTDLYQPGCSTVPIE